MSAEAEDCKHSWFCLISLLAYFTLRALVAIPNVSSFLLCTSLNVAYSLDRMVTLTGCFQFTVDMGSMEFSNQETEYKLRRGIRQLLILC